VALGPKQNRFIAEYLVDLNATQAAIRAGYSPRTAEQQGSRLLTNAEVAKAVSEAQERRASRIEVKQDDVLRVLLRHLNFDPATVYGEHGSLLSVKEMPLEARLAVQSLEWGEHGPKVKFWSKDKALELGMRHLGLLKDKQEVSGPDGGPLQVLVQVLGATPESDE
jgi:phage terminase small subunit